MLCCHGSQIGLVLVGDNLGVGIRLLNAFAQQEKTCLLSEQEDMSSCWARHVCLLNKKVGEPVDTSSCWTGRHVFWFKMTCLLVEQEDFFAQQEHLFVCSAGNHTSWSTYIYIYIHILHIFVRRGPNSKIYWILYLIYSIGVGFML